MLADYASHDQAIGLDFYQMDPNLALLLERLLPEPSDLALAREQAQAYGRLVGQSLAARAEETDRHGPVLRRYDRWGQETNEIVHNSTWLENKADLIRHGFVGMERLVGRPVPGVVSAAVSYLVSQAETAVYCGLGMTGGAADIVGRYAPPTVRDTILDRLTSLDPEVAWEGGMFLTERQGGSDVGANTTRAVADGEEWRLYGDKHFCSNVDADVFIVLARPEGAPDGSRGLATFIVPRHNQDGSANGFRIKRLKPKLGTTGVPTGEVQLEAARAWLAADHAPTSSENSKIHPDQAVGPLATNGARDARGINRMMEMVNSSRFGVALMGLGIHRRSFLEAAIYAANRSQFGQRIDSFPLVRETLCDLIVDLEAGMALTFECAAARRSAPSEIEGLLLRRILIPLAKMRATRAGLWAASTALEVMGGNGYMEDWPMARQLRDAQCHTIWEGTENILCLDVRRAIRGEAAHVALLERVDRALDSARPHAGLTGASGLVDQARSEAAEAVAWMLDAPKDLGLLQARRLAELLADVVQGALLVEEGAWSLERNGDARKAVVATRFARRHLDGSPGRGITRPDRTVID
ncbi:MAG: acyl-CoA dehydrogenase family protein, partial [Acidimicrobiales bacterium]